MRNIYWEQLYMIIGPLTPLQLANTKWKRILEIKPRENDLGLHFILISSFTALLSGGWLYDVHVKFFLVMDIT